MCRRQLRKCLLLQVSFHLNPTDAWHRGKAGSVYLMKLGANTRRYICDLPLSSPHANATSDGWAQSQPHSQLQGANGDHALSQIPEEGPWNWLEGLRLEFLTATGPALGDVPTGWSTAKVDCLCFSGRPPLAGTTASTRDRSFSLSHWRSFSAVKFLVGEMSGF